MTDIQGQTSRRRFLKHTTVGTLALWGGGIHALVQGAQPTASDLPVALRFFSEQEYMIIQAVARRLIGTDERIGSGANQTDVALRSDRFLAEADPELQEQFHQLLVVFNAPLFTFLFDFRLSSFIAMPVDEQETYLQDWMVSPVPFRRTVFQALKRLCTSMYYTDSTTWKDIGYSGMFLPWEAP